MLELRQLPTTPHDLRRFGLLVGAVLAALGAWLWRRGHPAGPWLAVPGLALMGLGGVAPGWLRGVYRAWMALALALGLVMSTVLLTLFFLLVITPLGLGARLLGRDYLRRRLDPGARSYWLPRDRTAPPDPRAYERQY
ncbi:MAG: hypothetical protein RJA22_3162 [Verrucomicrobiota bacterium]